MDSTARSSAALLKRSGNNVTNLIKRFENILALAPDQKSRSLTAGESYQIEVESAALIGAAEDLTALTRLLKELWLFGRLDTLGPSEAEGRAATDARHVARLLHARLGAPEVDGPAAEA